MPSLTDVFHKITGKTLAPQIVFNPKHAAYVVVDSKTGINNVQGQCIQPRVGMYSVLTIGDHLDVVVRYAKTLPYTLPESSGEDYPQVTYVVPRQDMKPGDFFTLFVGREHFLVEVIQILLPKSSSTSDSEKDSDFPPVVYIPRARTRSNVDTHSGRRSPGTGHRQDRGALNLPVVSKPVAKPLPTRPDKRAETVISTRTKVDGRKNQNLSRANTSASSIATAGSIDHLDRIRFAFVDPDPTPQEYSVRLSDKRVHQTDPSDRQDLDKPPHRPETATHSRVPVASGSTKDRGKNRRRSTTEHNNTQLPPTTIPITPDKSSELSREIEGLPLIQFDLIEAESPPQEISSSTIEHTDGESPLLYLSLREFGKIGKGYETGTMEDCSDSLNASVHSRPPAVAGRRRCSISRDPSQRSSLAPLESDIRGSVRLDGRYTIQAYLVPT